MFVIQIPRKYIPAEDILEVLKFLGLDFGLDFKSCKSSDLLDKLEERGLVWLTRNPVEVAGGFARGDFGIIAVEKEVIFGHIRVFAGEIVAGCGDERCNGYESYSKKHEYDTVFVVETKLDDVSGEILANAASKVMNSAIDIEILPATGKKCRPSYIFRALSKPEKLGEVVETLMKETGSTGVRVYRVFRFKSWRKIERIKVKVGGKTYSVRVKISGVNVKPEFEDVRKIAEDAGISLLDAYRAVHTELLPNQKGQKD